MTRLSPGEEGDDKSLLVRNIQHILERASTNDVEFLANISRELRTPLNGIVGVIDLMSHDAKEDTRVDNEVYLATLEQSCRTLLAVINRLQDISDLQSGTHGMSDTLTFDLPAVISGISQNMQFFSESSTERTQLSITFDERIPRTIKGNLTKLQQVLTNLCSISAQCAGNGYASLRVVLKYLYQQECTIAFEVKCQQVSEKKAFKLINTAPLEFSEVDLFDSTSTNNMLIGLNICRKFLQQLGSDLVVSVVDGSLSFTFELKVESEENKNSRSSDKLNETRVLVVDDNTVNVLVVTKMLKFLGIQYESVVDGLYVPQKLAEQKFDMIFMDIDMPGMDGYDTARYVREKMQSQITIIALTANSTNEAKRKCRQVGMNDFFTKPLTVQSVREMVCKWC